jgi:hypothetical protein
MNEPLWIGPLIGIAILFGLLWMFDRQESRNKPRHPCADGEHKYRRIHKNVIQMATPWAYDYECTRCGHKEWERE